MKALEIIGTFTDYVGIHSLITLLCCLLGVLLVYYFNVKANKRKLAHEAAKSFEKTFSPALRLLQQGSETSYFIVHTQFPAHIKAMLEFEHMPEATARAKFITKWTEYEGRCKAIQEHGKKMALDDMLPGHFEFEHDLREVKIDEDNKKEIERLINELLQVANSYK